MSLRKQVLSAVQQTAEGAFSCAKVLTMKRLMLFIMTSKSALQRGLDDFYDKINTGDYSIREVTKGAFSTARNKLNEWGFRRLNEVCGLLLRS